MATGNEFFDQQDLEIAQAKEKWREAAISFDRADKSGASTEEQERRLDHWQDAAREYWRTTNEAVANPGPLTGAIFDRWREDRIQTAHNMVSGLLTHQENVRHHRDRLKIAEHKYEFSPAVFENLQAVLAWHRPEEAKELRAKYADAKFCRLVVLIVLVKSYH